MLKSRTVTPEGQSKAVSSSIQRIPVRDRLGPSKSAHESTASKHDSGSSRSRAHGDARRRLVFAAEKDGDHRRKKVKGTPPRTRHRSDQDDKAARLAKMADEADRTMEVLLRQREDIAKQMLRIAELKDEASAYVQSKRRSKSRDVQQGEGKEPERSGHVSRGRPHDRRRSRSRTPVASKKALHNIDTRGQGGGKRRSESRGHIPEATRKEYRLEYSHRDDRVPRRSRSKSPSRAVGSGGRGHSTHKKKISSEKGVSSEPEGVEFLVKELKELRKQLAEVQQVKDTPGRKASPFSSDILKKKVDPTKKLPYMESYDGSGDPYDHSQAFERLMDYYDFTDAAKCHTFVTTLRKDARQWMGTLPANSVSSWSGLCDKFHARFGSNRRRGKPTGSLAQVRQFSNESLGQYVKLFRETVG